MAEIEVSKREKTIEEIWGCYVANLESVDASCGYKCGDYRFCNDGL